MTTTFRNYFGVIAILILSEASAGSQERGATFRTQTDVVSISAAVYAGRKPVPGLRAADFVLTDNGVVQTIDEVIAESVPIDVSLLVDVSGSTAGSLKRFTSDIREIASVVRADDRLRVVAFGTAVTELVPLQSPVNSLDLSKLRTDGATSLHDALAGALMRRAILGRRHLAVAFTDGWDTMSVLTAEQVREIARRSETVLHLVISDSRADSDSERPPGWPTAMRPSSNAVAILLETAELTGGRRGWPSVLSRSMVGAFRDAFDDFRTSYVLRYRPRAVDSGGWHEVQVKTRREGNYSVRARRGYFAGRSRN